MEVKRLDPSGTISRCTVHNGVVYFTGHSARPEYKTMREQTAAVLKRYDEIFAQFGLKKENILMVNSYLRDMSLAEEYEEVWQAWIGTENPPAGVSVGTPLARKETLLELAMIVAEE